MHTQQPLLYLYIYVHTQRKVISTLRLLKTPHFVHTKEKRICLLFSTAQLSANCYKIIIAIIITQ